ncbi:MAG TPA: hypothetical protein VM032_04930 [Vicinamibacterales bacterium]|nr:hypothetical protein [Vicinamibacterales bacterium]
MRLSTAETAVVVPVAGLVAIVLGSYVLDAAGLRFTPTRMFGLAAAAAALSAVAFTRRAVRSPGDLGLLAMVVGAMLAWLMWLARPDFLPLSTGPDLTHHLILIRYIEQHWRLVHEPALERYLGEMAQYTPGSHVLTALGGAWSLTSGLRALHAVQAGMVALETGFLLLIGIRLLPGKAPHALALVGVLLLLAAPRYFLGSFTEYGFVAQVVAQLFVVAMWWVIVAWDDRPALSLCLFFGFAGAAAFLTWPVYIGPPALAFFVVVVARDDLSRATRLRHLATAAVPIAVFAVAYLVGRLGWLQLAGTGGAAPWPSVASFSAPLVALSMIGLAVAAMRRRGRATLVFTAAVLGQAALFYLLARRSGAPQPYMALKMFYLLLRPMAACAVLGVGAAWSAGAPLAGGPARQTMAAWLLVLSTFVFVSRPLLRHATPLHPLPPAVSLPLYEAGQWALANVPRACVEYLVGDDETAYWLHLAVLGNPRMSDRTGNNATYEPNEAVMRWLTPNGLPFAIADLPALSRDVRDELDIVRRFGSAAVVRRRGPSSCEGSP